MTNNTHSTSNFLRIGSNRVRLDNIAGVLFWNGSLRIFNSDDLMAVCDKSPEAENHFKLLLKQFEVNNSSLTLPCGSFISPSMVGDIHMQEDDYLVIQSLTGYRIYGFHADKYKNLNDVADAIFNKLDGVTTDIDWEDLAVPTEECDSETAA